MRFSYHSMFKVTAPMKIKTKKFQLTALSVESILQLYYFYSTQKHMEINMQYANFSNKVN